MLRLAKRIEGVRYAIRDLVEEAKKVEAKGERVLKLNIGDPCAYDFDAPEVLKKGLRQALDSNTAGYSDSQGIKELREAVSGNWKAKGVKAEPEDVVVTTGLSEGVHSLLGVLVEQGDNVVMPSPVYPLYTSCARFYGGEARFYDCLEEEGWEPDADSLRKHMDEKTKAIVLINPNNPTGAVYSKKTLKAFLDVAGEQGVPVLSDEVYDELVFEGRHHATASLTKDVPVVSMNGLSKNYFAPGWRVGWISFQNFEDDSLKEAVLRLGRMRLCSPTPAQHAAAFALRNNDFNEAMKAKLSKRRDYSFKRLNEIQGISCTKPLGAMYAFPRIEGPWETDEEFVLGLLHEKKVLVVHGSGFDGKGKHFRIVFLPDEQTLEQAFNRLEEFMKEHA